MSTITNTQDYSVSSLDYVIADRNTLIEEIKSNREKHSQIYYASCSGYWATAAIEMEKKRAEFSDAISKLNQDYNETCDKNTSAIQTQDKNNFSNFSLYLQFNNKLNLSYPTHHFEDYDRIIKMLEFSVSDKIKLTVSEFDKYARNNWEWKIEFCHQSQSYLSNLNAISGCCFTTGSYLSSFLGSGAKAF